jgi:hypothetical protein
MIYVEQKGDCFVFGCQGCMDVNRVQSIRVVTSDSFKRTVRSELHKQGRLMTEAPEIRKAQMRAPKRQKIEWNGRKSKDGRFELVLYRVLGNGNLQVQMAVDGVLAPMMDDHIASREEYRTDDQYFSRIAESSQLMIHLYGDARNPLTPEQSAERQTMAY